MFRPPTKRELSRNITGADPSNSDRSFDNLFGEVTDCDDPESLGRIKVRLDYMTQDQQTDWISPSGGFQGEGFGSTFDFPSLGDKVRIHHVGGNIHNMVYSPGFFAPAAKGSINSAKNRPTPKGHKGNYKSDNKSRVNILRTISGWLISLVEGVASPEKWEGRVESPSSYDYIHWWTGGHPDTGKPRGVIHIQIDDLMEFWDYTTPDDEKAKFKWDSLNKIIQLKLHKDGKIIFEDYHEGKLEWDDKFQTITFTLPKKGVLSTVDNLDGNFTWDAEKSTIKLRLIDNLEVAAKAISIAAVESVSISAPSITLGAGASKLMALDGDPVISGGVVIGFVKSSAIVVKGS